MTTVALTIAGSDPSGGAGLQADLKTFHQHRVYGASVVTLVTAQNSQAVQAVEFLRPELVIKQLESVLDDMTPHAAKTGALGSEDVIAAISDRAVDFPFPLVVDPVMVSSTGTQLTSRNAAQSIRKRLLPHAFLVTPNLQEAALLAEIDVSDVASMECAARVIAQLGPECVLVKGGHLPQDAVDVLWCDGRTHQFTRPRIATRHTHGTGCVLSAAITSRLARGDDAISAVRKAKEFVWQALSKPPGVEPGTLNAGLRDGPKWL